MSAETLSQDKECHVSCVVHHPHFCKPAFMKRGAIGIKSGDQQILWVAQGEVYTKQKGLQVLLLD